MSHFGGEGIVSVLTKLMVSSGAPPQAYRLQSRPRGLALVLSNVHFTGEKDLEFRSGGDVDHSTLVTLFKLLGYKVHVLLDQTAQVGT